MWSPLIWSKIKREFSSSICSRTFFISLSILGRYYLRVEERHACPDALTIKQSQSIKILASTASIFTQILAYKPPNWEIFSSQAPKFGIFQLTSPQIWKFPLAHKPPFSEANVSSQAPHFGNPGRTPLPEKKSWVPPRGSSYKRMCIWGNHKCTISVPFLSKCIHMWLQGGGTPLPKKILHFAS